MSEQFPDCGICCIYVAYSESLRKEEQLAKGFGDMANYYNEVVQAVAASEAAQRNHILWYHPGTADLSRDI